MSTKIIYVDTPFWRAEVPRLSLFYGSIDYEDIRISREDFLSAKKNGFGIRSLSAFPTNSSFNN